MNTLTVNDLNYFISYLINLINSDQWLILNSDFSYHISNFDNVDTCFVVINQIKVLVSKLTIIDINQLPPILYRCMGSTIRRYELSIYQLNITASKQIAYYIKCTPFYLKNPLFIGGYMFLNSKPRKRFSNAVANLTPREREVCYLLSQGKTVKEVGAILNQYLNLNLSCGYIGNLTRKIYNVFSVYNHVAFMGVITKSPEIYDMPCSLFEVGYEFSNK